MKTERTAAKCSLILLNSHLKSYIWALCPSEGKRHSGEGQDEIQRKELVFQGLGTANTYGS